MQIKVRALKFGFLFLAFLLGVVLFMWPSPNDDRLEIGTQNKQNQIESTTLSDVGGTSILEPRFTGEDNKGRTWHLEASSAQQKGGLKTESIELLDVVAKAAFQDGSSVAFLAGVGEYLRSNSVLHLEKGVLVEGYGFTLETEALTGNLKDRTVTGDHAVLLKSPEMFVQAGNFYVDGYGEKIVLGGGVKGRLYARSAKKDAIPQRIDFKDKKGE